MTSYMPLLTGECWELTVLEKLSLPARNEVLPLFEVLPNPKENNHPLSILRERLPQRFPRSTTLAIDDSAIPRVHGTRNTLLDLAEACLAQNGPRLVPTVRLDSPATLLQEAREVNATHERGVLLRVPAIGQLGLGQRVLSSKVAVTLRALRLHPDQAFLLLDAGPVPDEKSRDTAVDMLSQILVPLFAFPWQRLFVATGAFPAHRPGESGVPRELRIAARYDAECWRALLARFPTASIGFADYALVPPGSRPSRDPQCPDPSLAYTVGEAWHLHTYERSVRGNDDFFTLSEDLLNSGDRSLCLPGCDPSAEEESDAVDGPHDRELILKRAASLSWGDGELARCALRRCTSDEVSGPHDLRAWGTSHHIEVVTERLRRTGTP